SCIPDREPPMSLSDASGVRGNAVLVARGPIGAEIEVVDPNYRVLARGTVEIKLTLPEGVYIVNWTAAGQARQKLVRLFPISTPLIVKLDEPTPLQTEARDDIEHGLGKAERPSEAEHGSDVVVILQGTSSDDTIDLRLLNSAEVAMRSDTTE